MSLDTIVDLQIAIQSSGISQPGFGTPVILTQNDAITLLELPAGEVAFFSSAAEMLEAYAGLDETAQEYIDAAAIMSQRPRPLQFAIARRAEPVAQQSTVTIGSVTDGQTINLTITDLDGTVRTASHTVGVGQTAAQVAADLETALDAIEAAAEVTGTAVGNVLTIVAQEPGIPFILGKSGSGAASATLATSVPVGGIAADLPIAAAANVYAFLIPERDEDTILTTAAAVEADGKHIFYAQSSDADILSTAYDDETPGADVASALKARGYTRTALFYHPTDAQPLAAAFAGRFLPEVPGSATGSFKSLTGVTPVSFTTTQLNNLVSKSVNSYRVEAGRGMTFWGTVASGEYIDVIHGIDKLYSRIQTLVFLALSQNKKIAMTDSGILALGGSVISALLESVSDGFIAGTRTLPDGTIQSPGFSVTVPRAVDIPEDDRAARRIPATNPIRFEATLAGAVHLTTIRGTVSV